MKRFLPLLLLFLLAAGCGGGDSHNGQLLAGTASNILPVSVSSGVCSGSMNSPCATITLCDPNLSLCQTIPDILIDTGSSGLRIFKSAIAPALLNSLPLLTDPQGNLLAECLPFADLTADWGPVQSAGIILGGEPPVTAPIQVIDSTFGGASSCQSVSGGSSVKLLQNPIDAASNGILGLDLFQYDLGNYFYCNSSRCTILNVPPPSPVQNPVFLLPVDDNGIMLTFPDVPSSGSASLSGLLTLGIGTRTNNQTPSGLSVFPVNLNFSLTTAYGASLYPKSYIDSGTNGFVIPDPFIPTCIKSYDFGLFCPPSPLNSAASNQLLSGSFQWEPFQIANADSLLTTPGNLIFNNIGFPSNSPGRFIWGFPFFLGKTIYFGYDHSPTPLGTGPFWAY